METEEWTMERERPDRDAIRDLVRLFRTGRGMTDAQRRRLARPFDHLGLRHNARHSHLRYEIPLDMSTFRGIHETVRRSAFAGQRLGEEWMPQNAEVIRKRTDDDRWVSREDIRVLDDVCTRFMTRKFFPDAFIRINMVINMIRMYDAIAAEFRVPYKIVFKGGVMMRLLILEFLHDLHISVRHEAIDYLSQEQGAVGVSDFDFEIVPDDRDQQPRSTYRQVLTNSLYLLWLRRYMEEGILMRARSGDGGAQGGDLMNTAWDYAESEYELRDMLQAEVDGLPKGHALAGARVDHVHIVHPERRPPQLEYRTRFDLTVPSTRENLYIFKQRSRDGLAHDVHVAPAYEVLRTLGVPTALNEYLSPSKGALYCTSNFHIGEHERPSNSMGLRSNFHLSRIKHAFYMYYTTADGARRIDRLAGEVIDLSQSHYGPLDERKVHMYEDHPHPWVEYPLLEVPGQVVRSYGLPALLHDIQDVLHHGADHAPWRNPKVAKRLVRYCTVLAMVTYAQPISRAQKEGAFRALLAYLSDPARVRRERMRRTRVPHVDEFADHEHMSMTAHDPGLTKEVRTYYASLAAHLKTISDFMVRDREARMDLTRTLPLDAMFVGHSDELVSDEPRRRVRCDFLRPRTA